MHSIVRDAAEPEKVKRRGLRISETWTWVGRVTPCWLRASPGPHIQRSSPGVGAQRAEGRESHEGRAVGAPSECWPGLKPGQPPLLPPASRFLPDATGAFAASSAPPVPAPTHCQDDVAVAVIEATKGAGRNRHHLHGLGRGRSSEGLPGTTQNPQLPCLPDPRESWERQRTSRRGREEADPKNECADGRRKRSGRSEKTGGWPGDRHQGLAPQEGRVISGAFLPSARKAPTPWQASPRSSISARRGW